MFQYNSPLILTYFFISVGVLILDKISKGVINNFLFTSYRSSLLNPLTYIRFITHSIGHTGWMHLSSNFIYILLLGPMMEEKYGSFNLLIMMLITSAVIGIVNYIFSSRGITGSSGIVFMLITLSSATNIETGKIPLTLIFVCLFYVVSEITSMILNFFGSNTSHLSHFVGAICGIVFVFIPIENILALF